MFCTIINDCKDQNAMGRQATRAAAILGCQVVTIGVSGDLEAAGNLVDVLDSSEGKRGVVLVNVAPRDHAGKKWPNGTPFGYFHYKDTLVVSSVDGLTLSLVKKLKLVEEINLLDIPTVLAKLKQQDLFPLQLLEQIKDTQFRSFEFLPRVAGWITEGYELPFEKYSLDLVADSPKAVWFVDNFGNCKTTLLAEEIDFNQGENFKLKFAELPMFLHLKDVPDNQSGLIVGSSGILDKRFLEIVVQGDSASKQLGISSHDQIV